MYSLFLCFSCIRGYTDNDKDCPVCHTKNIQLIDALRAQSESREQHGIFHDLLDRSTEPFSLVAEYFCRGLFNKIVIVAEDDMPQEVCLNYESKNFSFIHLLVSFFFFLD